MFNTVKTNGKIDQELETESLDLNILEFRDIVKTSQIEEFQKSLAEQKAKYEGYQKQMEEFHKFQIEALTNEVEMSKKLLLSMTIDHARVFKDNLQ